MRAIERIYRAEAMRYLAGGRTAIGCSALLSTVYLSEKGEVYPCTIWDKPLGNVRNTGFRLMPIIEAARRMGFGGSWSIAGARTAGRPAKHTLQSWRRRSNPRSR